MLHTYIHTKNGKKQNWKIQADQKQQQQKKKQFKWKCTFFSEKSRVYKGYTKRFKGIKRIIAVFKISLFFWKQLQLKYSFSTFIRDRNFGEVIQMKSMRKKSQLAEAI